MESILAILLPVAVIIGGVGALRSIKIVNQGSQVLVERLGKGRVLESGVNFINPFLDVIVIEDSLAERVLDIEPYEAITKDKVSLTVNAIIYWRLMDLELAYYKVDDIESALKNLVIATLRSEIGMRELQETFSSRQDINQALLRQLDEDTGRWGVKVYRIEVQDIKPAPKVQEAMELERAAESKKKASILEAEGTVKAMQLLSDALQSQPNSREVLQFLVAQRYVDASQKLGESTNAKIVYMSGEAVSKSVGELLQNSGPSFPDDNDQNSNSPNDNGQNFPKGGNHSNGAG